MRKITVGFVAATITALSPTLHAALMKPGLWEITTTMAGQKGAPEQKCYLQKDIDDEEKTQKGAVRKANAPCAYSDYKESGSTVTVKMTCQFGGGKSGTSLITTVFSGDTATSTVTSGATVNTIVGKRIGDCAKSSFDKR